MMIGAALGQWPAVATFTGLAVLLFGVAPRQFGLAWGGFGLAVIVGQVGPLLRFPQWVLDLVPFTHSPKLPGESVHPLPLILLAAVAIALTVAGVAGFRRRDIG
jgi:polyether ionophore transport system permease protein